MVEDQRPEKNVYWRQKKKPLLCGEEIHLWNAINQHNINNDDNDNDNDDFL